MRCIFINDKESKITAYDLFFKKKTISVCQYDVLI